MRRAITLFLVTVFAGCSQDSDTPGTTYSGKAILNIPLREFVATSDDTSRDIVLTMTGPHELTFVLNEKVSHLDYEKDVIIIRVEADSSEWSAKKIKGGFELENGMQLKYDNCQGWLICLVDNESSQPILKGKYTLQANSVEITLWISDQEKHVELLGLMTNALFNKSRNSKLSTDAALETLSSQIWTY